MGGTGVGESVGIGDGDGVWVGAGVSAGGIVGLGDGVGAAMVVVHASANVTHSTIAAIMVVKRVVMS